MYERLEKRYNIESVLSMVKPYRKPIEEIDGVQVRRVNSIKMELFKSKGTCCASCGLKGEYFLLEKCEGNNTYHFNLYATLPNGSMMLFTKDHIVPKSKGGKTKINNLQTMCASCNNKKGSRLDGEMSENLLRRRTKSTQWIPASQGCKNLSALFRN